MLVCIWVQGHGTSCHLQVRAHVYVRATKDMHLWTPAALGLAAAGVTETVQTPYDVCLVFILTARSREHCMLLPPQAL